MQDVMVHENIHCRNTFGKLKFFSKKCVLETQVHGQQDVSFMD